MGFCPSVFSLSSKNPMSGTIHSHCASTALSSFLCHFVLDHSCELGIQQDELRDVSIKRLQLHRIRLVAGRVAAAIPEVQRVLQVLVLRVVQVRQEAAEQNQ